MLESPRQQMVIHVPSSKDWRDVWAVVKRRIEGWGGGWVGAGVLGLWVWTWGDGSMTGFIFGLLGFSDFFGDARAHLSRLLAVREGGREGWTCSLNLRGVLFLIVSNYPEAEHSRRRAEAPVHPGFEQHQVEGGLDVPPGPLLKHSLNFLGCG
jgi:hypothetical protein